MNRLSMTNVLAGDGGGTSTRLGVFDLSSSRPRASTAPTLRPLAFDNFSAVVAAVLASGARSAPIEAACFGVAGPVSDEVADLTNVPWRVEARRVASDFGFARRSEEH